MPTYLIIDHGSGGINTMEAASELDACQNVVANLGIEIVEIEKFKATDPRYADYVAADALKGD